jgi:Zn-dependent protease
VRKALPGRWGGLFIGRVFGIGFYLDYSWFPIAGLVTWMLAAKVLPIEVPDHGSLFYFGLGVSAATLFFLSILLHELGHSLVSQRCGIAVPRITLLFIGGLAEISREPDDAKSELKIALGGPAVSVVLAVLFYGIACLSAWLGFVSGNKVCLWLAGTNLVLLIFNLFPGYPLDGGRVLRALLWAKSGRLRRATYITSRMGIGFAYALMALGLWLLCHPPFPWNALLLVLIGMFLKRAAESGYDNAVQREVLGGVCVGELMTRTPISIPEHLALSRAIDEYFLTNHHLAFPVCSAEGEFRGLLRLSALKKVPREKWPYTQAADAVAGTHGLSISVHETAARAMRELLAPGGERLAVVDGEKLVGFVTRRDLLQFIEVRNALET